MKDILGYDDFIKIDPVNKGCSPDKKYRIETADGRHLLLRVSDISEYERKKGEYSMLERAATLGIPMSMPVDFGFCDGGKSVYQLLTWCEGEDAEAALPSLSDTQQYVLGAKAGLLLKKLHSLPAPKDAEPWGTRFRRKADLRIDFYRQHPIKSDNADIIVRYLLENQSLPDSRPQTFSHGDFNTANLILSPEGEVGIIDFNFFNSDHGDPWWEFCSVAWGKDVNAYYFTGLFNGYFGGKPPHEFFLMQAYYFAYDALAALCCTYEMEGGSPEDGARHLESVLKWFDGMNSPVPTWYLEDFTVQYVDGLPYKLKKPYDMSFIGKYGKVFKVFDDQDSGNICFGVQNSTDRYFVKYAGAPTERANCPAREAVSRLKKTATIYRDLAHPVLVRLIEEEAVNGGYALIFGWADGECMGRMYPKSRERFMEMPVETKLAVFEDIAAFHIHIIRRGYVAVDFYDGSIMYDFKKGQTVICDIDFYSRRPYINSMGRLWGSSRFMSPEEFTLGAEIDEVTNVYTMGATAFALFSDYDRTADKWPLSARRYDAAKKAVSDRRGERQQSIEQFLKEWSAQ